MYAYQYTCAYVCLVKEEALASLKYHCAALTIDALKKRLKRTLPCTLVYNSNTISKWTFKKKLQE